MNTIQRKIWAVLFAAMAWVSYLSAQETEVLEEVQDISVKESVISTSEEKTNSLIWSISGNGIENPSFLFGTIHIIGSDDFFLPKGTEESFDQVKHVMMELDMDDPSMLFSMMKVAMMKDHTLEDLLGEDEFARLKTFLLDSLNVSKMQFMGMKQMKPMLGMGVIYPSFINGKLTSYEEKFMKMAKKRKLEISGLESIEDQMDAISSISDEDQAKMLMEMVDKFDEQKALFQKLIEYYVAEDIESLFSMMTEYEEISDVQTELLDERNQNWIPLIKEQTAKEPTFIAVGAAHLFGEQGVIQLLKNEGYTVLPVKDIK
ncbi:MAG: TraB/GumN family protein [Bacteroidota bacterium]